MKKTIIGAALAASLALPVLAQTAPPAPDSQELQAYQLLQTGELQKNLGTVILQLRAAQKDNERLTKELAEAKKSAEPVKAPEPLKAPEPAKK